MLWKSNVGPQSPTLKMTLKVNQAGFSKILTITILVIAVAGALYFLDRYTGLSIFSRKVGPGLPPTAGWQTYRNEEYGFEVKYPAEWHISLNDNVTNLISPETEKLTPIPEAPEWPPYDSDIKIAYYESANNLGAKSLEEYFIKAEKNFLISDRKRTILNGLAVWEAVSSGIVYKYAVFFEHDGHIYEFSFEQRSAKEQLKGAETQIFSTFKFIK